MNLYNTVGSIAFSESLSEIRQKLELYRKDQFDSNDRIIIHQDIEDDYPYIDAPGIKLTEIQKIINNVDISNCFILIVTSNPNIKEEVDFITKFYSVDTTPINFSIVSGTYNKVIKQYPNTACQKLWNHLYVGPDNNINPCCLADHRFPLATLDEINSESHLQKQEQIRSWMKQGFRTIACASCYIKEDINIPSPRSQCDPHTQVVNVDRLDIRVNNICNFKCRMCSEYFSSSILQETIKLYGKDAQLGFEKNSIQQLTKKDRNKSFDKIFPYLTTDLRKIYFAGGEPLLMDEHYQILDRLIEIGNTQLEISYNTNLSKLTYKNLNVADYWRKFDNVTIGASIDASDQVAEYVRHGTIWSEVVDNIYYIKNNLPSVNLSVTSTVSFLTIENLINLQSKWLAENLFELKDLRIGVLTDPKYLSPAMLPLAHKQRLSSLISKHIDTIGKSALADQWNHLLKFMITNDYLYTLNDFRHRTQVLDQSRSESFEKIFPEFTDLL